MAERSPDKRKMLVFVVLVVAALVCLGFLFVALENAKPHTDPEIKNGRPTSGLQGAPTVHVA